MADWGRSSGGSRGRVGTWDAAERRRRALAWAGAWTDGLPGFGRLAEQLRNWAIADTGPGRLLPWLPVAFGLGIAIYFTADREPAWWAGSGLAASGCVIAFIARRRPIGFPLALAFAAVAAGFAVATLKSIQVAHPILARPAGNVAVAGFVEVREERERTD
ncbi:MAG: competence protein ComEC, partial [Xanthobacteraceae bacterium]